MSPPDAFPEDVVDALSAITITGPDAQNLLWVSCKTDDPLGMLSVNADTIAGHAVARWRDIRGAALAKAVLARASQPET
jgi:hypothetical protein